MRQISDMISSDLFGIYEFNNKKETAEQSIFSSLNMKAIILNRKFAVRIELVLRKI